MQIILWITLFLAPLAILPVFTDPFGLPKLLVLTLGVATGILALSLTAIRKGHLEFSTSKYDLIPVGAALVFISVTFIRTRDVMTMFFVPGIGTIVIGAVLLYSLIRQLKDEKKEFIRSAILLSAVVSAGVTIVTAIKQSSFTLFGDPVIAVMFWLIILPLSIMKTIHEKDIPKKVFWAGVGVLLVSSMAVSSIPMLSGKLAVPPVDKTFPLFIAGASLLALFLNTRSAQRVAVPKFIFLIVSGAIIFVIFMLGKFAFAEYLFKQAGDALIAHKEEESYRLLQTIINANPYVDRYHLAYAQLNMIIAKELVQKQPSTQEERALVAQLTKQAVNEGKKTVFLSPNNAANWEGLGAVYESLPASQETLRFAAQAYSRAIILNPVSPRLRIDLARVYYAAGERDKAKGILTTVLTLATPASTEFWQAKRALEKLEGR